MLDRRFYLLVTQLCSAKDERRDLQHGLLETVHEPVQLIPSDKTYAASFPKRTCLLTLVAVLGVIAPEAQYLDSVSLQGSCRSQVKPLIAN
jgi:hypothetical protein